MAWRFRKSTKLGPFRLTATKRGLSLSGGMPGARLSVNSRGQVRRTLRIPGTGLYDTEVIRGGRRTRRPAPLPPPAAPEGWYADPQDPSRLRWWDGQRWTDQTQPTGQG